MHRGNDAEIRSAIEGRTVLVTGAAGSIGSELCIQIARFSPARIIGFDCNESGLFELDLNLRLADAKLRFRAEIGNIQSRSRINALFSSERIDVVFHAAAYKHVPLMENHIVEVIENNVLGTWNLVEAASSSGVGEFVLISSDKAVAPVSMMGATKRISELMMLNLTQSSTRLVAVRFGNVLGTDGSVSRVFESQIARGRPLTVTHPKMRRFFMSKQEACHLVLFAAKLAKSGQICVLKMNHSTSILDLALGMIREAGLEPDKDIPIEFTGMRPGERLVEQLTAPNERLVDSAHPGISIVVGGQVKKENLGSSIEELRVACKSRNCKKLLELVRELVPDYLPSSQVLEIALS